MRRLFYYISNHKLLMLLILGSAGLFTVAPMMVLGGHTAVELIDSPAFCTKLCHDVHYPEAVTFSASPHSEVSCSQCHVGTGTKNLVRSKVRGLEDIVPALLGNYERPLTTPLQDRRPSSETCEKCHTPQMFSGDVVRTRTVYQSDENNSKKTSTVVLKVGGGPSDIAEGIHWHVISDLWYLSLDAERLEIGWVGTDRDGTYKEYVNPASVASLTAATIESGKRLMDCVDCHNRVSHLFRSPDELIDMALQDRSIDDSLPFIKREAMAAIGTPRPNLKDAYARTEKLEEFYQVNYPDLFASEKDTISRAVEKLKEIALQTTFPENQVDWNTHVDNSGHNKPPQELMDEWDVNFDEWQTNRSEGCFRCHGNLIALEDGASIVNGNADGASISRALTGAGGGTDKILDASCNSCHFTLSQTSSPIPSSTPHPSKGLDDCLKCHGENSIKPVPQDHPWSNNEACTTCHQNAAAISLAAETTSAGSVKNIPHPTNGLENCLLCHDKSAVKPLGSDHVWSTSETCSACHKTDPAPLPAPSAAPIALTTPQLNHPTRGLENCLLCHGKAGVKPVGSDHPWSTAGTCSTCHKTAATSLPVPVTPPPASAPVVSHTAAGLGNCLLCHSKTGARPVNNNHPWATNETCQACHRAGSTLTSFPPPSSSLPVRIPHVIDGLSDCRLCHSSSGSRPAPANHAAIPSDFCTFCHQPSLVIPPPSQPPANAPSIPHELDGRDDCLSCHGTPEFEPPLPADHSGRTNGMCTACHTP